MQRPDAEGGSAKCGGDVHDAAQDDEEIALEADGERKIHQQRQHDDVDGVGDAVEDIDEASAAAHMLHEERGDDLCRACQALYGGVEGDEVAVLFGGGILEDDEQQGGEENTAGQGAVYGREQVGAQNTAAAVAQAVGIVLHDASPTFAKGGD